VARQAIIHTVSCHLLSDPPWTGRSRWRQTARSLSWAVEAAAQLDTFATVSTLLHSRPAFLYLPAANCPAATRYLSSILTPASLSATSSSPPATADPKSQPRQRQPSVPSRFKQRSLHPRSYRGITSQAPSFLPTLEVETTHAYQFTISVHTKHRRSSDRVIAFHVPVDCRPHTPALAAAIRYLQ
jgi:hypothetical protein